MLQTQTTILKIAAMPIIGTEWGENKFIIIIILKNEMKKILQLLSSNSLT